MRISLLLLALSLVVNLCAQENETTETITRELRFGAAGAGNLLVVHNINGGITVEGYDGDRVLVEVDKTVKAATAESRERAAAEVDLGVVEKDQVIVLYLKTPCSSVDPATFSAEDLEEDWQWAWQNNCRWEPRYDYRLDFRVRVPRATRLRVSTVNQGDVTVKEVDGNIDVNNVNGAITLEQIAGAAEARTINGDLTVRYARLPTAPCSFYTLNGDINAYFPENLSADMYFKSFNGDFFTELDNTEVMPPKLEKKEIKGEEGISYKIGAEQGLRVGNGGLRLEFETFNGNVYIRE